VLKTRVMPCLLLRGAGLVKTVKFKNPAYVGDPINTVRIYNEKEVDELIFLDITATPEGRHPQFKLVAEIATECFMPFAYGGGVRSLDDARTLFSLGAEKVAVNTYAAENPDLVGQVAEVFGSQSIIVSIDVRKGFLGRYQVWTNGGRRAIGVDPVTYATRMEAAGAGELLLTSIDRDGTFEGYDVDLIRRVASAVSIPVIACGGAGTVEDFGRAVRDGGASAVAAGSMVVYQGRNRGVLINFPSRDELKRVLV
jgi:imidazole glycerol-phosphate synthase subunit HisF